jgi:hypothetical protein
VPGLEERGYMLTGLVQVDEWTAVAVFVGAESFVIPSSVEVALEAPEPGPSEIVLEPEGLDKP